MLMNVGDFTVSKVGYDYETNLPCGVHFMECSKCTQQILLLVVPTESFHKLCCRSLTEDARFPGMLYIRCPHCKHLNPLSLEDMDANPYVEDTMMINSIEEW